MKSLNLVATFPLTIGLLLAVAGCQNSPVGLTPIPGGGPQSGGAPSEKDTAGAVPNPNPVDVSSNAMTQENYGSYSNLFDNPHN